MFKKTLLIILASVLVCIGIMGCEPTETPDPEPTEPDPLCVSFSDKVEYVRWIEQLTGADSKNETSFWDVGGTDLGFPIYNSQTETMFIAFGDTFSAPTQTGRWRCNVLAKSTDFDLNDGLTIDEFVSSSSGIARPIINGHQVDGIEMTKIPTGGVEINGTMYMFYFSKRTWSVPGGMNYGGAVKSTDNGETWERVYGMTWVNDADDEYSSAVATLINEDAAMQNAVGGLDISHQEGYNFTQINAVDGKDGYIYIFGEGGYRNGGIKLGRVVKENIELFDEYEYYTGRDASDNPVWVKGREGLDALENNPDSFIINGNCGEHSVVYNPYLQKWMVVMLFGGKGIVFCTADEVYGDWSEPEVLVDASKYPFPSELVSAYSGCTHELWTEDGGKTFYFVLSQWMPVYNSQLFKCVLK